MLAIPRPAVADDAAEIRARLVQWTEDFNAGHKDAACDLFSKELISDFRGQGEANYATRCALIAKAIDDPNRKFRYQLHIKEIMTGADLAVVRLDWTLEISPPGQKSDRAGNGRLSKRDGWHVADHPLHGLRGAMTADRPSQLRQLPYPLMSSASRTT